MPRPARDQGFCNRYAIAARPRHPLCPLEFRLRRLSGRGAETTEGPGLTHLRHRPAKRLLLLSPGADIRPVARRHDFWVRAPPASGTALWMGMLLLPNSTDNWQGTEPRA